MLFLDGIEYITDKQAAAKYGLTHTWFKNARYRGNGPCYYQLNGKIYYTSEDIDKWLKENLIKNLKD